MALMNTEVRDRSLRNGRSQAVADRAPSLVAQASHSRLASVETVWGYENEELVETGDKKGEIGV